MRYTNKPTAMIIWVCLKSGSTSKVASSLYKSGVQPSYGHTHVVGEKNKQCLHWLYYVVV